MWDSSYSEVLFQFDHYIRDGRTGTEPLIDKKMVAKQERGTFEYTCHAKIVVVRQSDNNVVACSSSINTVNPVKKCSGTSKVAMTQCDGIEQYIPLISQARFFFKECQVPQDTSSELS